MMSSQRNDTEKNNPIEEGKKQALVRLLNKMKILIKVKIFTYKIVSSYCLKRRKNTKSINPKVSKTKNGKTMILPKCVIRGSKESICIKKQVACGILRNLGLIAPLNKIPLLVDVLF